MVVLAHHAVPFVANEVMTVVQLTGQTRVGVRIAVIDLELDLMQQLAGAIDFDDSGRPALRNHHASVVQWLKRVNLDSPSRVPVRRCRIVSPNDFPPGDVNLHNFARSLLHHERSAGQRVNVMDPLPGHLPFDAAISANNCQLPISLQHDPMLGPNGLREQQDGKNRDGNSKSASHVGDRKQGKCGHVSDVVVSASCVGDAVL